MKFNKNAKQGKKQQVQNKETEEIEDTHHADMLKGVDQKFSVFNRKQNRKIKKMEKKQKKQTFFSSTKDQKKQIMMDKIQKEQEEQQIKRIQELNKKDFKSQQQTQEEKEELKRKKLEQIEKQRQEREKRQLEEKIKMDDEEIKYFEKLLGKKKGKTGEKRFSKELKLDGWEDDLFSFLDNISTTIKTDVKQYKPFFQEEGILEDAEVKELVEESNAPISLVNGPNKSLPEDDDDNPDQEGFTEESNNDIEEEDEELSDLEEDEMEEEEEDEEQDVEDDDEEQDVEEEDDDENMEDENGDDLEDDDEEEESYYDDIEDEDEDEYEYVEEKNEELKPEKKEIKSILKGSSANSVASKEKEQSQKGNQKDQNKNTKEEKKELSEIEKWKLEKQQKKEQGMTEEEKERQRILVEMEKKDFEKKNLIRKSIIQGYNRLSETNIDIIFKEILDNFQSNAKNLVTPILADIFMKTTIEPVKVMQHIMASNTVVVSAIHQIYDNEGFGPIMKSLLNLYQEIIQNKDALQSELEEDSIHEDSLFNKLRNITIVFSYFYIFDDVSIDFISGYLEHLLQNINQRTIEALLILVQHVGAKIRQDNPQILKNIIDNTKAKVDEYSNQLKAQGKQVPKKIEFVMLTLNDIRLNKKLKTDPVQRLNFFINWLKKNIIQKMKLTKRTFPVDFKFAFNSKRDTPRWYSYFETGAYRQDLNDKGEDGNEDFENRDSEFSHLTEETKRKLEQLAIKCRMTTDTRKRIFMLVMSSEDYVDAAQRILKLKVVKKSSQEVAVVVIQCCAQEKKFNPFYSHLTQKLIEINPKIKFSFQYALWDQFKTIERAEIRKINNLAKYAALLCSSKSLGITALKFFDLENLSEQTIIFLKIFLGNFFKKISQEDLDIQINKAIAREENFVFVEGFKEFLKNYYWKSILTSKEKDNDSLKDAVKYTVKKLKIQPKIDKLDD
ncbi:MA3 domain protein (macronuclear) [Tetrahymena thermophila SB210]|uniref:MA3 domain protein n=1 Tax=Tetrahymena thermophila (strain SB210) TaxID=312017 RepID=I7LUW4_TETTS|nr:MA3 domain protein [Tetrahymena thermophila SB210]EAR96171.2 MA3 domain protein [Tetrahymena thermophila SB210]|eukprot:XP_001016416.2 MA3 domain protein [Tetrahymena thermophila SB210]